MMLESVGLMGTVIISMAGMPQLIKTIRTKSVDDLSFVSFFSVLVGAFLLLIYSLHTMDFVYITGDVITISVTSLLIFFILRWRLNKK